MKTMLLAIAAMISGSTVASAQTNNPIPAQPAFVEKSGAFPADGQVYDPPSTPPPAYAYTLPSIPSNFRIADDLSSTTNGTGDPSAADKKFRTTCGSAKVGFFDPILAFNRPNWGHLHEYGGNTGVNYDSTYLSLRTTGDGTCGGRRINRSAYWWPAMIDFQKNKVVRSVGLVVYYTMVAQTPGTVGLVNGLTQIGGYNLGDRSRSKLIAEAGAKWTKIGQNTGWSCRPDGGGAERDGGPSFLNADGSDRLGDCHGILVAVVNFPDCWDGVNLSAPNGRDHMRESQGPESQGGISNRRCPPGYYPIPQFEIKVQWRVEGYAEYKNWAVSSDRMPGMIEASGTTFHSDWFGAWDTGVMRAWLRLCSGALTQSGGTPRPADCNYTAFGDGRRGKVDDINPDTGFKVVRDDQFYGTDKYQDIPGQYMPGYPGIAKGTNIAELMNGHSLKAGNHNTVH